MFNFEQINEIHEGAGKQATFPEYLQALQGIGTEQSFNGLRSLHSSYK
jgi:hypothetical protein